MMRQPTPESELYAWWRAAVADLSTPRHDGEPHCGFYKMRMVKGGPFVPATIVMLQKTDPDTGELTEDEVLAADQNGKITDPVRIWSYCRAISREEYDALTESHRTINVMAATHAPVDLSTTAILPGGKQYA